MDIRRAALITSIACVLGLLMPVWNGLQRMATLEATHPGWWIVAVIGILVSAIPPVFYFSLYRNEGTLRFSRREQSLALITALMLGVSQSIRLPQLVGSLAHEGATSVLTPERGPWTFGDSSTVSGILFDAAYILMMMTVYRHVNEESDAFAPVSKFLRIVSTVAVIAWGILVAFNLARLFLTPYTYSLVRRVALQIGRTPPAFRDIVAEATSMLLWQVSIFVGFYIIWRGSSQPKGGLPAIEPPTSAPTDSLSG